MRYSLSKTTCLAGNGMPRKPLNTSQPTTSHATGWGTANMTFFWNMTFILLTFFSCQNKHQTNKIHEKKCKNHSKNQNEYNSTSFPLTLHSKSNHAVVNIRQWSDKEKHMLKVDNNVTKTKTDDFIVVTFLKKKTGNKTKDSRTYIKVSWKLTLYR